MTRTGFSSGRLALGAGHAAGRLTQPSESNLYHEWHNQVTSDFTSRLPAWEDSMRRRTVSSIVFLALVSGVVIGRNGVGLSTALASRSRDSSPYTQFVGRWFQHGGDLVVYRNGYAFYSYRTYVFCTGQVVTACDKQTKNTIFGGGFSALTLHRSVGNKAYGSMNNSAFSWQVGTAVTLVAMPNDTLVLHEVGTAPIVLCGSKAPAGRCGA